MATYAHLAAKLLRDAATFFRNVGAQNQPLKEQMDDNASVYEQVADLVEKDPMGVLDIGDESSTANK
jgi:hypothetical protein